MFQEPGSNERGQAMLLSTIWLALAVALAVSVVWFGQRLGAAGHAQGVADAVALAGAVEGRDRAEGLAARNDALLIEYRVRGGVVSVVVVADGARAESTAMTGADGPSG